MAMATGAIGRSLSWAGAALRLPEPWRSRIVPLGGGGGRRVGFVGGEGAAPSSPATKECEELEGARRGGGRLLRYEVEGLKDVEGAKEGWGRGIGTEKTAGAGLARSISEKPFSGSYLSSTCGNEATHSTAANKVSPLRD